MAGKPDLVWLRRGDRILAVGVGQEVAGVGKVDAIVKRAGTWRLLDAAGRELLGENHSKRRGTAQPITKGLILRDD